MNDSLYIKAEVAIYAAPICPAMDIDDSLMGRWLSRKLRKLQEEFASEFPLKRLESHVELVSKASL